MFDEGNETEGKKRKVPSWLSCASSEDLVKRKKECHVAENNFSKNDSATGSTSVDTVEFNIKKENITEEIFSTLDEEIIIKNELDNSSESSNTVSVGETVDEVIKIEPELIASNLNSVNNTCENEESTFVNKKIKTEPVDDTGNDSKIPSGASKVNDVPDTGGNEESSLLNKIIKTEKVEDAGDDAEISSGANKVNGIPDGANGVTVKNEPQANTSQRRSCKFGIKCYRQNPVHRVEEAHPGDIDYRRPEYPEPPKGTPICPYGNFCYRRNPMHFQQFSHPDQNLKQNDVDPKKILRDRKPVVYMAIYPDENSSSDDDFSAGSEDEFDPAGYQESDEGVDVKDEQESDDNDV